LCVTRMSLSKYSTNFKDMWENMGLFYTTLNKLLMALLCIHLTPKDVGYGSSARSYREDLEKKKRKDSNGLKILNIKSTMANSSIYDLASVQQVDDWKKNAERKTKELKNKKYVDRLCRKERYFVLPVEDRKRIIFVGDRGLAVGSRLKGFMRYGGGLWKPKRRS
ncbi:hypothetical protein CU098_011304, partial [Rhizopus stolonifer]